jgi:hypothetical protein
LSNKIKRLALKALVAIVYEMKTADASATTSPSLTDVKQTDVNVLIGMDKEYPGFPETHDDSLKKRKVRRAIFAGHDPTTVLVRQHSSQREGSRRLDLAPGMFGTRGLWKTDRKQRNLQF